MRVLAKPLLGAVLAFAVAGGAAADVPESERPIRIPLHNWTGAQISGALGGQILERMGYNVEYVALAVLAAAAAVADGEVTYTPEIWDNNMGEHWPKLLEAGQAVDMGDVGIDGREGWLYPRHMEEMCPGLPDWDVFLGCAEAFSTAETFPNGRFLDYPSEWQSRAGDLIRKEGLPFDVVPAGSEGSMVAELNSAVERQAPLVMMFWAPHWVLFQHEYGWVDIPDDLVTEYSLQKPRIFKIGWPGIDDEWPVAARFLRNFRIDNRTQELLMGQIDNEGRDLLEVTDEWLDDNPDVWQPMVDAAMAGS